MDQPSHTHVQAELCVCLAALLLWRTARCGACPHTLALGCALQVSELSLLESLELWGQTGPNSRDLEPLSSLTRLSRLVRTA